ncbi:hypothetical protein HMPREF1092_03190 [Clostridium thermobutyricum]|uniref:Uncharacterized protein n=1 Tax=Clostridium thermobutyricum TaxID=29372 RepID=N9W975_9CLOT|nr:hypothetical protein [Clostridium thermobutyricum]ENY99449.1 hypothetical protein HMPREF1092_03190 [Clostridium thermobutyricum]
MGWEVLICIICIIIVIYISVKKNYNVKITFFKIFTIDLKKNNKNDGE